MDLEFQKFLEEFIVACLGCFGLLGVGYFIVTTMIKGGKNDDTNNSHLHNVQLTPISIYVTLMSILDGCIYDVKNSSSKYNWVMKRTTKFNSLDDSTLIFYSIKNKYDSRVFKIDYNNNVVAYGDKETVIGIPDELVDRLRFTLNERLMADIGSKCEILNELLSAALYNDKLSETELSLKQTVYSHTKQNSK
jgi:hypothetical protein